MDKTERRICLYSSILIGLIMSSPRLLALRENGIVAHYWHFNLGEFLLQLVFNIGFCCLLFYLNLAERSRLTMLRHREKYFSYYFLNALLMLVCCAGAGGVQRWCFMNGQSAGMYWSGYLTRFFLSALLTGIIIKIILLIRESKQKDAENNQLKTAYLEAELNALKEQLNPHFLFNSLSSLSGLVEEDPTRARLFINHLSKIFRYSLTRTYNQLVTIEEELMMIKSYEQLLKMRFENAFQLEISIDNIYLGHKIPHLTLQPLIENAAKHNSASLSKPLKVNIFVSGHNLVVSNNLQEIAMPENSTCIGLANLNSRFRILMGEEIEIERTAASFAVKLPLNL